MRSPVGFESHLVSLFKNPSNVFISAVKVQGDYGGLRLDFVDFDSGVPWINLLCPIYTTFGQTEEQPDKSH